MNEKMSMMEKISSKNIAFIGLIAIFFLLIFQSALSLFFEMPFEELEQIDIIFRTSIISIFGYLMSMVSNNDLSVSKAKKKESVKNSSQPKVIGFNTTEDENLKMIYNKADIVDVKVSSEIKEVATVENTPILPPNFRVNTQIIVLTLACIFCLVVMLVARNFSFVIANNSTNTATFSLFRDIISGSIGALIGLSKS